MVKLVSAPSRLRVLPASRTRTRLRALTVTPIPRNSLWWRTRSRGATLTAWLRSKILRISRRFYFLCSTKLSRLPHCLASSNSGTTSESKDIRRGVRPNRSSNDAILEGSESSGRVPLIQHAEATYSSQRSGQALQSLANIS